MLRTGVPSRMSFDARLRFGCNGTIEIFVETVRESFLANVAAHVGERRLCRAVTIFAGEENELGSRILSAGEQAPAGAFIQEIQPLVQLLIFGDGPDSTPLRSCAEMWDGALSRPIKLPISPLAQTSGPLRFSSRTITDGILPRCSICFSSTSATSVF